MSKYNLDYLKKMVSAVHFLTNDTAVNEDVASGIKWAVNEIISLRDRTKKLEMIIDNGLGEKDLSDA